MVYNLAIEKNVEKVREHLRTTRNPLIFFDDDADGLCSFLLLFHFMGKAKGIPLKTAPILNSSFLQKVEEYNPDSIFVLDIPNIEKEFFEKVNVPIIWIDHHAIASPPEKNTVYMNPRMDNNAYLPTSYMCHHIVQENMWLGVCGSIADYYMPEYIQEFKQRYQSLFPKKESITEIRYNSKLGEVIGLLSFMVKGKIADVKKSIILLEKINFDELIEKKTITSQYLWNRYEIMYEKYKKILEKAEKSASTDDFLVYISDSEENSFVGDISNELVYKYPKKIVVMGRSKNGFIRMSMRSSDTNILPLLKKAMTGLHGYCGGHEKACGGNIDERDFGIFLERVRLYVEEARGRIKHD